SASSRPFAVPRRGRGVRGRGGGGAGPGEHPEIRLHRRDECGHLGGAGSLVSARVGAARDLPALGRRSQGGRFGWPRRVARRSRCRRWGVRRTLLVAAWSVEVTWVRG